MQDACTQTETLPLPVVWTQKRAVTEAAETVLRALGAGHSEACLRNALAMELQAKDPQGVVAMERTVKFYYMDTEVGQGKVDIAWEASTGAKVFLELKVVKGGTAFPTSGGPYREQLQRYLRACEGYAGILVIFHSTGTHVTSVAGVDR